MARKMPHTFAIVFFHRHDFGVLSDLLACCSNYLTCVLSIYVCCPFDQVFCHGTLVQSFYNLTIGEVRHDNEPIPITFSALVWHLEKLTFRGILDFSHLLASEWIMSLLKTSSSLKRVSLVLFCSVIGDFRKFPIGLVNWAPLVRLLLLHRSHSILIPWAKSRVHQYSPHLPIAQK